MCPPPMSTREQLELEAIGKAMFKQCEDTAAPAAPSLSRDVSSESLGDKMLRRLLEIKLKEPSSETTEHVKPRPRGKPKPPSVPPPPELLAKWHAVQTVEQAEPNQDTEPFQNTEANHWHLPDELPLPQSRGNMAPRIPAQTEAIHSPPPDQLFRPATVFSSALEPIRSLTLSQLVEASVSTGHRMAPSRTSRSGMIATVQGMEARVAGAAPAPRAGGMACTRGGPGYMISSCPRPGPIDFLYRSMLPPQKKARILLSGSLEPSKKLQLLHSMLERHTVVRAGQSRGASSTSARGGSQAEVRVVELRFPPGVDEPYGLIQPANKARLFLPYE